MKKDNDITTAANSNSANAITGNQKFAAAETNEPGNGANITPTELELLDEAGLDEKELATKKEASIDNTDDDGDLLNESATGDDFDESELDIPGADLDDDDEALGEEDEENNGYSEADTE